MVDQTVTPVEGNIGAATIKVVGVGGGGERTIGETFGQWRFI